MILIIVSLLLGFLGLFIGANLGGEFFAFILGSIGILSPALYILEKMYKEQRYRNEFSNAMDYDTLDSLRSNSILEGMEYEKACLIFNEMKDKSENKSKYDNSVDVLYRLSQGNIISDDEYNEKIRMLKTLYEQ